MVTVEGLTKTYGSKKALDDVSFTINQGEVVGLLGLNGAGKSTTMNILAGCLASSQGSVSIGGMDILQNPLAAKAKVGYLPEQPPLYVDMKVFEFLWFVSGIKNIKSNRKAHIEEVCGLAGLAAVTGRLIKNLSKGYRQRVGLASALLGNPEALILDEPTVGLDPTQMLEMRNLIQRLGESRTVLFSSHILSEVQAVCKRVIVLNQGKIIADDTAENLNNTMSGNSYVALIEGTPEQVVPLLGTVPGMVSVSPLEQQSELAWEYMLTFEPGHETLRRDVFLKLSGAGLPLLATRNTQRTLEDIFMNLVNTSRGEHVLEKNKEV